VRRKCVVLALRLYGDGRVALGGRVIRPLAIVAMLLSLRPGMGREQAQRYASIIATEGAKHGIQAATTVALVNHESHWRAGAEGDCTQAGCQAVGLGQLHYEHFGACRTDPEPVSNPGRECLRVREALLDGEHNLRTTIRVLGRWAKTCRAKTGRWDARAVLSGYAGLSRPPSQWCGRAYRQGRWVALPLHPAVADVLRLRARLLRFR